VFLEFRVTAEPVGNLRNQSSKQNTIPDAFYAHAVAPHSRLAVFCYLREPQAGEYAEPVATLDRHYRGYEKQSAVNLR
jgi:hypothetical protein